MEDRRLFYSWSCFLLLDVSIRCVSHSFQNVSFFQSQFLTLLLWIFDLLLPVGDKFSHSDDKLNCQLVIGLG